MKRPSPGQHLWFGPVRTNRQCDDVLDETVRRYPRDVDYWGSGKGSAEAAFSEYTNGDDEEGRGYDR